MEFDTPLITSLTIAIQLRYGVAGVQKRFRGVNPADASEFAKRTNEILLEFDHLDEAKMPSLRSEVFWMLRLMLLFPPPIVAMFRYMLSFLLDKADDLGVGTSGEKPFWDVPEWKEASKAAGAYVLNGLAEIVSMPTLPSLVWNESTNCPQLIVDEVGAYMQKRIESGPPLNPVVRGSRAEIVEESDGIETLSAALDAELEEELSEMISKE